MKIISSCEECSEHLSSSDAQQLRGHKTESLHSVCVCVCLCSTHAASLIILICAVVSQPDWISMAELCNRLRSHNNWGVGLLAKKDHLATGFIFYI